MRWAAAADDGGDALTKYVVIASTAYADINVEAMTTVHVDDNGVGPATEANVKGLTNGLVYSFQVVASNAFGYSARSLPSNKVGACAVLLWVLSSNFWDFRGTGVERE